MGTYGLGTVEEFFDQGANVRRHAANDAGPRIVIDAHQDQFAHAQRRATGHLVGDGSACWRDPENDRNRLFRADRGPARRWLIGEEWTG